MSNHAVHFRLFDRYQTMGTSKKPTKNKTILVIEDNELNMKLIRSLLQIGGYNILEVIDAETGIQMAREHLPDLILMDVQLPGMDGLSATRIIRKDPKLQHIPVIALTSYAMRGNGEKSQEAGCAGYITKPINTRSFLKMISQYLDYAQPKDES